MVPEYKSRWPDVDVKYLVISTDDYIVCLDNDLDVDWKTSDEYDKSGHNDEVEFNKILNNVALFESRPQHHLNNENKKSFRRMLGEAVARALAHDYKSAESILDQAQGFLLDRSREKSREWYLATGAASTILIVFVMCILFLFREEISLSFGIKNIDLLISITGGTIGAFMSITLRLGKSRVEADSGVYLHVLESISRITAGGIGGLLAGILMKLGIVVPTLNVQDSTLLTLFAIGFAAGASERFIPSFISTVEKEEKIHE